MSLFRSFEVCEQKNKFTEGSFKIDEVTAVYEKADGSSSKQTELVFDRGDASAVLLFNARSKCVVLVKRFRTPTLGKGLEGGWITETITAPIMPYEPPEAAAARAVRETAKARYAIDELKPIATFFSSPGACSERIHLYYAAARDTHTRAAKNGRGDSDAGDDVQLLEISIEQLWQMLRFGRIEDPKAMIAAMWLTEELKHEARQPFDEAGVTADKHPLNSLGLPGCCIGYKTGSIEKLKGEHSVSVWVNSENEDMIMDRFIGRSISAIIRYLGADKDAAGNVTDDIIHNELTRQIGIRGPVRIGTVIETGSGYLAETHNVDRILHVATVRAAGPGQGVRADLEDLYRCAHNVLARADAINKQFLWLKRRDWINYLFGFRVSESIIIPMIGAGEGGLQSETIAPRLFSAALQYFKDHRDTTLKEVYFLAYTAGQKEACARELARLRAPSKQIETDSARGTQSAPTQ